MEQLNLLKKLLTSLEGGGLKCIICGRRRPNLEIACDGVGVCDDCYAKLMSAKASDYYDIPVLERLFAPFPYDGNLRAALLDMKFKDARAYAAVFARLTIDALPPYYIYSDYDMLIPVPLHPKRLEKRGYNQAELLACEFSKLLGVPMSNDVLFRIRSTEHQMTLPRILREKNVRGAFAADKNSVAGKRIILIDDIYTIGATLRACAGELYAKGASCVSAIVIAENFDKMQNQPPAIRIPVINR